MRRAVGIALLVAFVASCAAGAAVLLLPYDHETSVPGFDTDVDVRCQAPMVDAVSKDDATDGWFVMDPSDNSVTFSRDIDDRGDGTPSRATAGGSLCYPDSVHRAALGIGLLTLGGTGLIGRRVLRIRRRDRGDDQDILGDQGDADEPGDVAGGADGGIGLAGPEVSSKRE